MKRTLDKLKALIMQLLSAKHLRTMTVTLAAIVVFVTTYVLILPAFTLGREEATDMGGIDIVAEETVVEETAADAEGDTVKDVETPKAPETGGSDTQPAYLADTLEFEGDGYTVSAEVNTKAKVPEDTKLSVVELDRKTEDFDYDKYYNDVLSALKKDSEDAGDFAFIKFYDISLMSDNEEVEPSSAVNVEFRFEDDKLNDAQVIHFGEEEPEVLDTKTEGNNVSFETGGFSIYAVVDDSIHTKSYRFYWDSDNDGEYELVPDSIVPDGVVIFKETDENNVLLEPNKPEKDGYDFTGWYDRAVGGTKYVFPYAIPDGSYDDSSTPIYAQFEPSQDKIYIHYHDYSPEEIAQNPTEVDSILLSTVYPRPAAGNTRTVYIDKDIIPVTERFEDGVPLVVVGWKTIKEDGTTDTVYNNGDTITLNNSSEDIHLYPVMAKGTWIFYESNGGTYVPPVFIPVNGTTSAPQDPSKIGYIFGGWYRDEGLSMPFTFGGTISEATTLYAKWTPQNVSFRIKFYVEKGGSDGYSVGRTYVDLTAPTGSTVTVHDQIVQDVIAERLDCDDSTDIPYTVWCDPDDTSTTWSGGSAPTDPAPTSSIVVKGDGTSIINLYFNRKRFTVGFKDLQGGEILKIENVKYGDDLLAGVWDDTRMTPYKDDSDALGDKYEWAKRWMSSDGNGNWRFNYGTSGNFHCDDVASSTAGYNKYFGNDRYSHLAGDNPVYWYQLVNRAKLDRYYREWHEALVDRDKDGNIVKDTNGNPVLIGDYSIGGGGVLPSTAQTTTLTGKDGTERVFFLSYHMNHDASAGKLCGPDGFAYTGILKANELNSDGTEPDPSESSLVTSNSNPNSAYYSQWGTNKDTEVDRSGIKSWVPEGTDVKAWCAASYGGGSKTVEDAYWYRRKFMVRFYTLNPEETGGNESHVDGPNTVYSSWLYFLERLSRANYPDYVVDSTLMTEGDKTYVFKGWYDNETYEGEPLDLNATRMQCNTSDSQDYKPMSVFAKWELVEYSFVFHLEGGNINGDTSDVEKTSYSGETVTATEDPEFGDLTFIGWVDENGSPFYFGTVLTKETMEQYMGSDGKIHLYAVYSSTGGYRVIYDHNAADGGTGPVPINPALYRVGASFKVQERPDDMVNTNPEKLFLGWKSKDGYLYQADCQITITEELLEPIDPDNPNSEKVVKLIAMWGNEVPTTKLVYDFNEQYIGIEDIFDPDTYAIATLNNNQAVTLLPFADVSQGQREPTGYRFAGWYDNPQCTGDALTTILVDVNNQDTENIVYAKWIPIKLRIYKVGINDEPLQGATFEITPQGAQTVTATSLGNGLLYEEILKYSSYTLHETQAPAECVPMSGDASITVDTTNGYKVTLTQPDYNAGQPVDAVVTTDADGTEVYSVYVHNNNGAELPNTGGSGTWPYTLGGIALITAAALVFGFRRRKEF